MRSDTQAVRLRSALGVLVEQEIARSRLSLNEFAKRAGVSPATVSRLVNGEQRSAQRATLEKLAKLLGDETWHLELLGSDIPMDKAELPEVDSPPGVLELELPLERAIDQDQRIPPTRKKWLKQCVEFARTAP
jgi:transcriptional regulator with XRE-family HTH domain